MGSALGYHSMKFRHFPNLRQVIWQVVRQVVREIRRTIWKTCAAFNYDLYSVERFTLRWMICVTLNNLHYVEWFIQRWAIFYILEKFVQPQMICTVLKDLDYVEWFGVRSMICTTFNHLGSDELLSIGFLISARCAYSKTIL